MTALTARRTGRFCSVKKYIAAMLLAVSFVACAPRSTMAADEDVEHYDARAQGYDSDMELKSASVGMTWMVLLMMGVVCVSVTFKDAKRSHLD